MLSVTLDEEKGENTSNQSKFLEIIFGLGKSFTEKVLTVNKPTSNTSIFLVQRVMTLFLIPVSYASDVLSSLHVERDWLVQSCGHGVQSDIHIHQLPRFH